MAVQRQFTFLDAAAATADQSVVAAGTGFNSNKSIVVFGIVAFANGAGSIFFESGTTTKISATFGPSAAAGPLIDLDSADEWGWFQTVAGQALTVTTAGAGTVGIQIIWGYR